MFCKLTPQQLEIYTKFVDSISVSDWITNSGVHSKMSPLKAITILKKLCNHPNLVAGSELDMMKGFNIIDKQKAKWDPALSGKLLLLVRMLDALRKQGNDKVL